MAAEDEAIKRNLDAHHNLLFGGRTQPEQGETDEMGNIILGDHITQFQQPQSPPSPVPSKGGIGKALIGAGLLATGIGAPLGAYFVADALKPQPEPTPIVQPAEPEDKPPIIITEPGKNFDWRVGDPIVE